MSVGIKAFAQRVEALDAAAFQHGQEGAFRHLDPGHQGFDHVRRFARLGIDAVERPAQVVAHGQNFAGEVRDGVSGRVLFVAFGPAAHVFGLGQGTQGAVVGFGKLGLQRGDALGRVGFARVRRHRRDRRLTVRHGVGRRGFWLGRVGGGSRILGRAVWGLLGCGLGHLYSFRVFLAVGVWPAGDQPRRPAPI